MKPEYADARSDEEGKVLGKCDRTKGNEPKINQGKQKGLPVWTLLGIPVLEIRILLSCESREGTSPRNVFRSASRKEREIREAFQHLTLLKFLQLKLFKCQGAIFWSTCPGPYQDLQNFKYKIVFQMSVLL